MTLPPDPPSPASPTPEPSTVPKQATLLEVAGAVFWSFFGVRKGRDMLRDATSIKPAHVVIVGLLAGLAFVLVLLGIVTLIVRNAG